MPSRRNTILPLLLLLSAGCAAAGNTELLEARLREQEDRLVRLSGQLETARTELLVSQRDADALRAQLADNGRPALLPEQADSLYRVEGIELSRLLTGSIDRDGKQGDEMLSAVILPVDEQGSLVKVPGTIELELIDLSQPEDQRQVGKWSFDGTETSRRWHRGLVGSGYTFRLPWQKKPSSSRLLLLARLTTADGRRFETQRQIAVHQPGEERKPVIAARRKLQEGSQE